MIERLRLAPGGQGLFEFTRELEGVVERAAREHAVEQGLCTLFVQHTSASLVIQENADPSARVDLEPSRLAADITDSLEGSPPAPPCDRSFCASHPWGAGDQGFRHAHTWV